MLSEKADGGKMDNLIKSIIGIILVAGLSAGIAHTLKDWYDIWFFGYVGGCLATGIVSYYNPFLRKKE